MNRLLHVEDLGFMPRGGRDEKCTCARRKTLTVGGEKHKTTNSSNVAVTPAYNATICSYIPRLCLEKR